ncbi:hypothetical protein VI817_000287 [Penicillium citrinum]|uniref:PH domain-containing protein n=1 Tax=Penicillium hetheringtonii TaxID=911720 RepID=A0AAD6E1U6_9EURO|nr:hypothetical protein N7450_000157 [Penicillium hetheringtonii]KAK5806029.1 hypothetical protein VI817_000287 [Penicillium citrinum]
MSSISRDLTQPSFGERRGHRLAPLQTNFSRPAVQQQDQSQSESQSQSQQPKPQTPRLQRPRPTDPTTNGIDGPVPLQSPVKRQSSKSSLRSIFGGRDKTSRAAVAPESKLNEIEENMVSPTEITSQTATIDETLMSPDLATPHTTMSTTTTLTSPTTPRARNTLKTGRAPPPEPKTSQDQYGWKPPPLFQAYPQSTKHDCLSAPAMSADSILRLHATSGKGTGEDGRVGTSGQDSRKKEQRERKHMRTLSGTINKVEWTKKIYVLATAGFILQYAGDGKHDRLPEKMLQLGPHSVAFASDAIPGKHWVVQISQNPAAETIVVPEPPKPRLGSRFGFHRTNTRRLLAQSFLMVFENPDSMISWLIAIRAEVEARGGPKFVTEKHSEDEVEPQLRSKASVRQMVKKDPNRISSLFLQPQTLRLPAEDDDDGQSVGGMTLQSRRSSYVSDNRRSVIDSRAGSSSTGRTEATPPMNADASGGAFSTFNTPALPQLESDAINNPYGVPDSVLREVDEMIGLSPPNSSTGAKRQSFFATPLSSPPATASASASISTSTSNSHTEPVSVKQSASNVPETFARSASPPAPNFSVPSFSKKFVPKQGSIPSNQVPPLPSGASALRRGESISDLTISTVSSPPQSPTYSIASSRHTDSSEPVPMSRDSNGRVLRTYNSEDLLSRMARAQPAPNFSRVPRASVPSETSPPPSRPLSLVGRTGLGIQMKGEPQTPVVPPMDPGLKPDLQPLAHPPSQPAPALTPRNRVPPMHVDTQLAQSMSRRRSMPGLAVGPPAAPPPNCPLPKLPPAANIAKSPSLPKSPPVPKSPPAPAPAPAITKQAPVNRFYQSQKAQDQVTDKRKSGIPEGPTPKTAARKSRIF